MGIIRNMANTMRKGRVGQDTYYVSKGRQVVRQAKNNSNYGESATRTLATQTRRVMWANLVNLWRQLGYERMHWFEGLNQGQSMYNRFMQMNVPIAKIPLTKKEAHDNASFIEEYFISEGSLKKVGLRITSTVEGAWCVTDIMTMPNPPESVTIGQLSTAIIQENTGFEDGDILLFCYFYVSINSDDPPFTILESSCYYEKFVLDVNSSTLASTLSWLTFNDYLGIRDGGEIDSDVNGIAVVHAREDAAGTMFSTQKILGNNMQDAWASMRAQSRVDAAIESYGGIQEIPLAPGE